MNVKRGLVALAVVALLGLGIAIPVVAGSRSIPGMNGVLHFTNSEIYMPGPNPPDPAGPAGTMTFAASVRDYVAEPFDPALYQLSYVFTARRLAPCRSYALVNPRGMYVGNASGDDVLVKVVAVGRTNRAGLLCIKGSIQAGELASFMPDPWTSGARIYLVPNDPDVIHPAPDDLSWLDANDAVLISLFGLPITYPENFYTAP